MSATLETMIEILRRAVGRPSKFGPRSSQRSDPPSRAHVPVEAPAQLPIQPPLSSAPKPRPLSTASDTPSQDGSSAPQEDDDEDWHPMQKPLQRPMHDSDPVAEAAPVDAPSTDGPAQPSSIALTRTKVVVHHHAERAGSSLTPSLGPPTFSAAPHVDAAPSPAAIEDRSPRQARIGPLPSLGVQPALSSAPKSVAAPVLGTASAEDARWWPTQHQAPPPSAPFGASPAHGSSAVPAAPSFPPPSAATTRVDRATRATHSSSAAKAAPGPWGVTPPTDDEALDEWTRSQTSPYSRLGDPSPGTLGAPAGLQPGAVPTSPPPHTVAGVSGTVTSSAGATTAPSSPHPAAPMPIPLTHTAPYQPMDAPPAFLASSPISQPTIGPPAFVQAPRTDRDHDWRHASQAWGPLHGGASNERVAASSLHPPLRERHESAAHPEHAAHRDADDRSVPDPSLWARPPTPPPALHTASPLTGASGLVGAGVGPFGLFGWGSAGHFSAAFGARADMLGEPSACDFARPILEGASTLSPPTDGDAENDGGRGYW